MSYFQPRKGSDAIRGADTRVCGLETRLEALSSTEHRDESRCGSLRGRATFVLGFLTLTPLLAQQEPPIARVPVRLVIAPTSVTDQRGKFINGLTLTDFTLFDNETQQRIHEDADFLPISLAVAIETNLTVEGILPRIHELGPLLGTLVVGDGGECSIMTFDKHVNVVQNFTSDLGRLTQTLHHIEFSYASSHLIDATLEAIHLLQQRPRDRRRILLLISETRDRGSESKLRDAVAEAELNNILIYSLNVSRAHAAGKIFLPSGQGLSLDIKALIQEIYGGIKTLVIENPLSVLTRYTGGRQYPFLKQHSLEDAVTRIGEEIHGQYLLSYSPSNLGEGGFHKIRVELNKAGFTVRSRPGYWSMDDVGQASWHVNGLQAGYLQNRDRKGALMGLRPTKSDEDAAGPFRAINNLNQVFNGAN